MKSEKKQLSVLLPVAQHQWLKQLAEESGTTMAFIVTELISKLMEQMQEKD